MRIQQDAALLVRSDWMNIIAWWDGTPMVYQRQRK
jgi:hypothetical protein